MQIGGELHSYSFFRLVSILYAELGIVKDNYSKLTPDENRLFFLVSSGLNFPKSDVDGLELFFDDENNIKYIELSVNFLGLHGTDSPLPSYYLEEVANSYEEDAVKKYFLDFFNHRMLLLLYQIMRKYKYYICYTNGARDAYSVNMLSLFGVRDDELRDCFRDLKWDKMLAYSGFLSSRSRSPDIIGGVISHSFDLVRQNIEVKISNFVFRKVMIPISQRFFLGLHNTTLGHDAVIGERVPDRAGKFLITLSNLHFDTFRDFLPKGEKYAALKNLVQFMLKDQFAYDLRLELMPKQTPSLTLKVDSQSHLGWSSFLGKSSGHSQKYVLLTMRT